MSSVLPQASHRTGCSSHVSAPSVGDQANDEHVLAAGNPLVGRAFEELGKPSASVGPEPLEPPLPYSSPQAPCLSNSLLMPTSGCPGTGPLVPRKGVRFSLPILGDSAEPRRTSAANTLDSSGCQPRRTVGFRPSPFSGAPKCPNPGPQPRLSETVCSGDAGHSQESDCSVPNPVQCEMGLCHDAGVAGAGASLVTSGAAEEFCNAVPSPKPASEASRHEPSDRSDAIGSKGEPLGSSPAEPAKHDSKRVPGARASPVTASGLWSEWFGALSSSDCSLSIFFHSLRELPRKDRGPSSSSASSCRRVWPMPLAFSGAVSPRELVS